MKKIKIDITSRKLDEANEYLWEAIMMICEKYALTYYEIFGLLQSSMFNLNRNTEEVEDE